jgi:hypothetical protein
VHLVTMNMLTLCRFARDFSFVRHHCLPCKTNAVAQLRLGELTARSSRELSYIDVPRKCARSSAGESNGFLIRGSGVRVTPGA